MAARNGTGRMTRLAALLTAGALLACGGDGNAAARQDAGEAERNGARAPGGASAPGADLEDAQIAALVALINGTEMAAAKAVQPKLAMPEVRAYAGTLIADHARITEAMPSFDGPRRPPPQSETLNAVFHSQAAMLGTLPAGYAFDATFVAAQVADHVMAIDSLWRWREVARDPELRRALGNAIPVMESHLAQARALYARLDQRVDLERPGPPDTAGTQP
jgi:predicted outer membrane protein